MVQDAEGLGLFTKPDRTIFDILEKRHLERTLADVLAFFCDPNECHPFHENILRALLECVPEMNKIVDREQITLQRLTKEDKTENSKRLDLVLEGDNWVLGIETKINAGLYNPFQQYKEHISEFEKEPFTIIFAPKANRNEIKGWPVVHFEEFVNKVTEKLKIVSINGKELSDSKWGTFLRDFLLNLANLEGRIKMEKMQADFVISHYSDIVKIAKLKDDFEKHMLEECKEKLRVVKELDFDKLDGKSNSWAKFGTALIFETEQWGSTQKLVFLLLLNGEYRIQFEVSRENDIISEKARTFAIKDWKNGGYWSGDFNSIDKAFIKFQEAAMQLTAWKKECYS